MQRLNEEDGNSNPQPTAAGKEPVISSGSGWWKREGSVSTFQVKVKGVGMGLSSPSALLVLTFPGLLLHCVFGSFSKSVTSREFALV